MTKSDPSGDPVTAANSAINALLAALEGAPGAGAAAAYRSAITRHGRNLMASAGPEALAAVLDRIRSEAADKAQGEDRERIVRDAWAGLMPEAAIRETCD